MSNGFEWGSRVVLAGGFASEFDSIISIWRVL
jgi:hypothetical protein